MANRETIERVRGTADVFGADAERPLFLENALRSFFDASGYQPINTPVLEHMELYFRKSGGEIATKLYSFTDQGGHRVCLRPEFTASAIRAYIEHGQALPLPLRWQYCGPVFRYERPQRTRYRQFTQCGVELLGGEPPLADAEVIALAHRVLLHLGINKHQLVIGHVGVIHSLLDSLRVTERVKVLLTGRIEQLSQGAGGIRSLREHLIELGLLKSEAKEQDVPSPLEDMSEEDVTSVIAHLLAGTEDYVAGSRSKEDIIGRFVQKLKVVDDSAAIERAVTLLARLASVRGQPQEAIEVASQTVAAQGLDPSPLEQLGQVTHILVECGVPVENLIVDFGLARGLAYYTGIIFEIHHTLISGDQRLCGGGRYDGLVKDLGGQKDIPALGFAFGLERLDEAIQAEGGVLPSTELQRVQKLVVPASEEAYGVALRYVDSLRQQGQKAELDVRARTLRANLDYARRRGMKEVLVVQANGEAFSHPVQMKRGAR